MANVDQATGTITGVKNSVKGINRTDGISPLGLIGRDGVKNPPGFLPVGDLKKDNSYWYGNLLESHPDYSGDSVKAQWLIDTKDRFDLFHYNDDNYSDGTTSASNPNPYRAYSTRDNYLLFNDSSTDYFKHGLHSIYGKTPIRSNKNSRESWDGFESGTPQRLSQVTEDTTGLKGSLYENNDPVIFGFEIIIDAISSPLLNGSVEDFIDQFNRVSEIASKKPVIADFKQQFMKLFKTKGIISPDITQETISIKSDINTDGQVSVFQPGKKAYMSYYLKKIDGLNLLLELNSSDKKKYLTEYRKDVIKFTFTEDVSLTMGTLSHLYKLLYWSKPNGKNLVPDNLLRFNCDIIISEVRNLNRVRAGIQKGNLEVVKDNLSRHIYSLKECQFWFDQSPHENDIDLSSEPKEFESVSVTMDFKYVTSKFERWTPDGKGFGKYVGYNNGAMWKIGNPGARIIGTQSENSGTIRDISVPKFFTINSNTENQNGVLNPVIFNHYNNRNAIDTTDANGSSVATISQIDNLKNNGKSIGRKLAKNLKNAVAVELQSQINIRMKLLNDSLDKIRNAYHLGRMREPTNIYKIYYANIGDSKMKNPWDFKNMSKSDISPNFFYDVHNDLRAFGGEALGNNILGNIVGGGNNASLFNND